MKNHKNQTIITLSDYTGFEKNQEAAGEKTERPGDRDMDFVETLFRFLGDKRRMVFAFVRMKLDRQRRTDFVKDLADCENPREQARCVRQYIRHLKVGDARSLVMSLPEMMPEKIEALAFHGETDPANRLRKFAKTFGVSDAESLFLMVFLLMIRDSADAAAGAGFGRAV
jgi:hypothetical protein